MKTKYNYIKPESDIINIESESIMAISGPDRDLNSVDNNTGEAYSRKRDFWDN